MAFNFDFVGIGGLAVDLVLRVSHLPIADEKYNAHLIGKLPGGFIANATCAAARLGLRAGYVGWVGDDADGTLLHNDFLAWGVNPAGLVRVPGELTPFTVVITDSQGHRAILIPGSRLFEAPFTAGQLALVGQARAVLTFPRDLVWFGQLRRITQQAGALLALDIENTVPMQGEELRQVIRLTDVVFLKRSSLTLIGTWSLPDLVAPSQWLVMTGGGQGVLAIEHGMAEPFYRPSLPVPVVDTTGAGDCFHAAMLAAKLDGADLVEALAFANAAAALKVQHTGPRGGLPTRIEVEALLNE